MDKVAEEEKAGLGAGMIVLIIFLVLLAVGVMVGFVMRYRASAAAQDTQKNLVLLNDYAQAP